MATSREVLVMVPEPASQEDTPEPNDTSDGFPQGDLFTWHGTELIFIPLMMLLGIAGNLLVYYIYHFRWRSNTVTLYKKSRSDQWRRKPTVIKPDLMFVEEGS
ncbi:neuropeptide y [Plakobranchus ocellatus]|uniref:Neuropeptide y n=1 Tax=Plakobranchus ocellatus TaxID=259542 RepID=A0AAV4CK66_9GAST|nr:neuropeptide y [Plakobranchus ocellatus]